MYTLVLPFHNGDVDKLKSTLSRLKDEAAQNEITEIIVAHNGLPLSDAKQKDLQTHFFPSVSWADTDQAGIGAGYKAGIQKATKKYVILSASDLPFGWTDLKSFKQKPLEFAIGSKAHPNSDVGKTSAMRKLSSALFWMSRRVLLGRNTPGDSQGTLLVQTETAKELIKKSVYNNYLFSLELICLFQLNGRKAAEIPVVLENNLGASSVSIMRDGYAMFRDLVKLSWQIRKVR